MTTPYSPDEGTPPDLPDEATIRRLPERPESAQGYQQDSAYAPPAQPEVAGAPAPVVEPVHAAEPAQSIQAAPVVEPAPHHAPATQYAPAGAVPSGTAPAGAAPGGTGATDSSEMNAQTPTNPADYVAATEASEFATKLKGIAPESWKAAGIYAALALAGAFVAALATTILFLIGVGTSDSSDVPDGLAGNWFTIALQLMGMGLFHSLKATAEIDASILGNYSSSVTLFFVPLIVVIGAVTAVGLLAKKFVPKPPQLEGAQRWIVAVAGGLAFTAVTMILTTIFGYSLSEEALELGASTDMRAASIGGFIFSLCLVGGLIYWNFGARPLTRIPAVWTQAFRTASEHVLVLAALAGVGLWITMIIQAEDERILPLVLFPIIIPIAATVGAIMLLGGTVGASGSVDVAFGQSDEGGYWLTMFSSELPTWLRIVAPIVAIVALLIASLRWRARRQDAPMTATEWLALPAAYFVVGIVITVVTTASVGSSGSLDALASLQGTAGAKNWTPFLFALVGLLIVLAAKYLFAPIVGLLPRGVATVLLSRLESKGSDVPPVGQADFQQGGPQQAATQQTWSQNQTTILPVTQATPEQAAPGLSADQVQYTPEQSAWANTAQASAPAAPAQAVPQQAPPAQPAPAQSTQALLDSAAPMNPKTKKRIAVGAATVLGLVVLAVAANIAHGKLAEGMFGPQNVVEDYLGALVSGEAEKALSISSPNVKNAQRVLLTDEVYKANENRLTDYRITDVLVNEDNAVVEAKVTQDGQDYPMEFEVKKSGKQAIFFDDWKMGYTSWGSIEVSSVPEEVQVNGVSVKLPGRATIEPNSMPVGSYFDQYEGEYYDEDYSSEQTENSVALLPGRYVVSAPAGTKYVTYGDNLEFTVTPDWAEADSSSYIHFEPRFTGALFTDATALVNKALEKCVQGSALVVEGCEIANFEDQYWEAMTGISRSWDEDPSLSVVDGANGAATTPEEAVSLSGEGLSVRVDDASIRIDYKARNDAEDEWQDDYSTRNPFLSGYWDPTLFPITIDGDKLTVDTSAINVEPEDWRKDRD